MKLLAPNGKQSNLTPEQYRLVRTPAFKAWFGDWDDNSKNSQMLLDDNGEPLVLWRGDDVDFNAFDISKNLSGKFWFVPSEEYASNRGRYVKPYFIKSEEKIDLRYANGRSVLFDDKRSDNPYSIYITFGLGSDFDEYVCYNPLQIKLADGSNTTFDGSNPDIRFKDGGSIEKFKVNKSANDGQYFGTYRGIEWSIQSVRDGKIIWWYCTVDAVKADQPTTIKATALQSVKEDIDFRLDRPDLMNNGGSLTMRKPKSSILLAPNGKPTNLTPEQYKLVRTPEFKAWFGDWEHSSETSSKVVDENGEPLVVYHGTPKSDIESFESVTYFSDNIDTVIKYASETYDIVNPKVYSCFLNFRNPRVYEQGSGIITSGVFASININSSLFKKLIEEGSDGMIGVYPTRWYSEDFKRHERGIYGDYIKEKHFITFYSTQIKLADGSNTTFDVSNPDIRYDNGGQLSDLLSSQEIEHKLGRGLHWWNDDIVYLSGIKYKKVYLRPEYKRVTE